MSAPFFVLRKHRTPLLDKISRLSPSATALTVLSCGILRHKAPGAHVSGTVASALSSNGNGRVLRFCRAACALCHRIFFRHQGLPSPPHADAAASRALRAVPPPSVHNRLLPCSKKIMISDDKLPPCQKRGLRILQRSTLFHVKHSGRTWLMFHVKHSLHLPMAAFM